MFAHRPGLCYCCESQGLYYDDIINGLLCENLDHKRTDKFIEMKKQPPLTA